MNEKVFRTTEELIHLLSERGVSFDDPQAKGRAKKYLQREGYYNLINGYNDMFLADPKGNQYKPGTTVDEIYALYSFDRQLRQIFFESILSVETNTKSLIAYEFSKAHGHKNYLVTSNFKCDSPRSLKQSSKLIGELYQVISSRGSDPSISHYLTFHGYVPLWVLNNIMTFGAMSKFYSLMLQKERQQISKTFRISDDVFENFLLYLSKIRNFCAHGNRIYCFRTQSPLADTPLHANMDITRSPKGEYICGKRDLFACMIALKYLLSSGDYNLMSDRIQRALSSLEKRLHIIDIKGVRNAMGFPDDWIEIKATETTYDAAK
jgi:abortive infection bacteriophage resistance protein